MLNNKIVIISIHPSHIQKIINGEKQLEFRRRWSSHPIDTIVIYATSPIKRIVATASIAHVFTGSKTKLWNIAQKKNGGISRRQLFTYLEGMDSAVAIELTGVRKLDDFIDPVLIFGHNFRPPQSYRYVRNSEFLKLLTITGIDNS